MRALGLAMVLLGWVSMGVGCAAGVVTAQAPAPARPAPEAPADVSPVPAPAGIRLELRISHPRRDLATVAQLVPTNDDVVEALRSGPVPIVGAMIGADYARLVDFDGPADLLSVGASADFVLSLPISDSATSLPELDALSSAEPSLRCVEMAANPHPRRRLICAESERLIREYGPYLARTAAVAPVSSAFRMTLPVAPMYQAMQQERPPSSPGEAAGRDLALDLFAELEAVSLELDLEPGGVALALELRATTTRSVLATALAGRVDHAAPVLDAFWSVPKSADLALLTQGVEPNAYGGSELPVLQSLWRLSYDLPLAPRALDERVNASRRVFFTGGPLLYARGQERARSWTLLYVRDSTERLRDGVHELVRLLSTPADSVPVDSTDPSAPPKPKPDRVRESWARATLTGKDGLPKGSFALRFTERPNPDYRPEPEGEPPLTKVVHTELVFFPDREGTWLAISEERQLAIGIARAVVSGKAEAGLAAREELAPLRAAEGQLAGFVSLAGVAALAASSDTAEVTNLARELASLPDRGETAILVRGGSSRSGASGAVTRVRVVLTPTALSSLFRWALAAAAGGAS